MDDPAMMTRALISGIWFISLWFLGGALSVYFDVPRAWMLLPTLACAAGVWIGLARYDAWRATRSQRGMLKTPTVGTRALGGVTSDFDVSSHLRRASTD
jgi:hypothetical protein